MAPMRRTNETELDVSVDMLDATSTTDRREAIRRLPDDPDVNVALVGRLEVEPVASVRELILTTLVERRTAQTVKLLLPFLGSEDAALRNAVAGVLTVMPELVAGEVPALLAADDHDVRIMTVVMLGKLLHPQVPAWLVNVVEADPHPNVVGCALNELLQLGVEGAAAAFSSAATRFPDDPFIAFLVGLEEARRA